jgi:uncharacterized protein involved in type VI secretion and phage assembly
MTLLMTVELESSRDPFTVEQCTVHERISAPFDIELVALSHNADVDLAALSGSHAKLSIVDDARPHYLPVVRLS